MQDKEQMMKTALDIASTIASMSPVAVQGSKINLVYSRDHSVGEGLDYNVSFFFLFIVIVVLAEY